MKVILTMVTSIDGKSTKGDKPPAAWASKEDQDYFKKLIGKHKVIIMGRKTYESARSAIKLSGKTLRIVMTKNIKKYARYQVDGQLKFTDYSALRLYDDLKEKGYKEVLFVSGESLAGDFLKASLIDEIWLSLEPKIFGKGKGMVKIPLDISLKLKSISKLNKQGTLLLKYNVS